MTPWILVVVLWVFGGMMANAAVNNTDPWRRWFIGIIWPACIVYAIIVLILEYLRRPVPCERCQKIGKR
jgi:hypothetical protein